MNPNPEVYNALNVIPKNDANKLFSLMKQSGSQSYETVVDVGCGTGNICIKFLEQFKCEQLIAFDNNEAMIEFAKERNFRPEITFRTADVNDELSKLKSDINMKKEADVVYSVHCLNWVSNKAKALENIHGLLKPGGKCFLVYIFWSEIFEIEKLHVQTSRWNDYVVKREKNFEESAPRIFNSVSQTQIDEMQNILNSLGFKENTVGFDKNTFTFENFERFREFFESVSPYFPKYIPIEMKRSFFDDHFDYILKHTDPESNREKPFDFSYVNMMIEALK